MSNTKATTIVSHRTYGKSTKPTIYYFTGYGSKIDEFSPHIKVLVRAGFRVVAFEYDKTILSSGNAHNLIDALKELVEIVNKDKLTHKLAGVYGISLGSWLGANVLVACNIRAGMFNTGGASLTKVVWETPDFESEKEAFQKAGYTNTSLGQIWQDYEFTPEGRRWEGKHSLIMASDKDEIVDIHEVRHNVVAWQKSGDDVKLLITPRLGHKAVIKRHILRLHRTVTFFREATRHNLSTQQWIDKI